MQDFINRHKNILKLAGILLILFAWFMITPYVDAVSITQIKDSCVLANMEKCGNTIWSLV